MRYHIRCLTDYVRTKSPRNHSFFGSISKPLQPECAIVKTRLNCCDSYGVHMEGHQSSGMTTLLPHLRMTMAQIITSWQALGGGGRAPNPFRRGKLSGHSTIPYTSQAVPYFRDSWILRFFLMCLKFCVSSMYGYLIDFDRKGYLFFFFFRGWFWIFLGFLVLCFPAFLLFCFSASLLSCFLLFLFLCFSCFFASLLFMLLCFSCFFASLLFMLLCFPCFSAFLLLCFCAFLLLLFYFFFSSVMCFCCSTSCSFASLLPVFTASLFFSFALFSPGCILTETQRNPKEILMIRNPYMTP